MSHIVAQFVEVEIEFLPMQSFAYHKQGLKLRHYHLDLSLAANAYYCFDLLFVCEPMVDKLASKAVKSLDLHDWHIGELVVVYADVEEIA